MNEEERRRRIALDSDFKWKQIGFRDGNRGDVHDTYVLKFRELTILVIRHYVELSLGETPLIMTIPNADYVDVTKL